MCSFVGMVRFLGTYLSTYLALDPMTYVSTYLSTSSWRISPRSRAPPRGGEGFVFSYEGCMFC